MGKSATVAPRKLKPAERKHLDFLLRHGGRSPFKFAPPKKVKVASCIHFVCHCQPVKKQKKHQGKGLYVNRGDAEQRIDQLIQEFQAKGCSFVISDG